MNQLIERQNEEHFIRMLAAQRQLYSDHKRQVNVWVMFVVFVAILGAIAARFLGIPIAIVSFLLIVADFAIVPRLEDKRVQATQIQELFDTELFELSWNSALGAKPSSATIDEYATKHLQGDGGEKRQALQQWYDSPDMNAYPLHLARIIAQKENVWWDSTQRRRYAAGLTVATVLFGILLAALGFLPDWDLQRFDATPLLVFLPLLVFVLRNIAEHREAARRLDRLAAAAGSLWADANGSGDSASDDEVAQLTARSRYLQTEIYHNRMQNPPVSDWVFNKFKARQEESSQAPGFFNGLSE